MEQFAHYLRRHLFWLLLGSYLLAALWPAPGLATQGIDLADWLPWAGNEQWQQLDVSARLPLVLVAIMLVCAAMSVDVGRLRELVQKPTALVASLAAVWIGPAICVAIAGMLSGYFPPEAGGLLLGLTLVAAMPVANSSAGWTQQSEGNLAWSLGLIVLSIMLSPWVTPLGMRLLGFSLSASQAEFVDRLVLQFSGVFFIVWVLAPTLLGLGLRQLLSEKQLQKSRPYLVLITAAALLLLNYANGALALPQFLAQPRVDILILAALLSIAICFSGLGLGWAIGRGFGLGRSTQIALCFGLGMKHNGLALGLAGTVLADTPGAILLIVVATITQHLIAATLSTVAMRNAAKEQAEAEKAAKEKAEPESKSQAKAAASVPEQ